ncbi:MAG: hypothetical protein L7U87_00065 [Chlamydiales bacterium]|nr:hypothetical protein [Chlamydiales bacterium]
MGHAYQKHARKSSKVWGVVKGNSRGWHAEALKHLGEILSTRGGFRLTTNSRNIKFIEKKLQDGRGVRLQMDYKFKGFLD